MSSLARRIQKKGRAVRPNAICAPVERLTGCAIVRDGETHSGAYRSHAEVRESLGDEDPYKKNIDDTEGFVTSLGRFVDREEAKIVGMTSGQLPSAWANTSRAVLSSDINWSRGMRL